MTSPTDAAGRRYRNQRAALDAASGLSAENPVASLLDVADPPSPNTPTDDEKAALDAANAPDGMNPFATMADVGGGVSDPLVIGAVEASDYVAVGASPASTGAIRLEDEAYVKAGNYRLIGLNTSDGWVEIDPDDFGVHFGTDAGVLTYGSQPWVEIYEGISINGAGLDIRAKRANVDHTVQLGPRISSLSYFWDASDVGNEAKSKEFNWVPFRALASSQFQARLTVGDGVFNFSEDLKIFPTDNDSGSIGIATKTWGDLFITPPTSDPTVAGQVYEAAFADISALDTYLQGGGKLLARSAG